MSRVYKVVNKAGEKQAIRAQNPAQAIRHAARNEYTAKVASQSDLIDMLSAGIKVQDAGEVEANT